MDAEILFVADVRLLALSLWILHLLSVYTLKVTYFFLSVPVSFLPFLFYFFLFTKAFLVGIVKG